jgi:hypothetical protein
MSETAPDEDFRKKIVAYVNRKGGVKDAAAQLGISKEALARASAGFSVRPGTLALLREKIR